MWAKAYLKEADRPFKIAVERDHGKITVYETRLRGEAFAAANIRFAERLVKMLLWSAGGFRIYLQGDDTIAAHIRDAYRPGGAREFDAGFEFDMFERPLEVIIWSSCMRQRGRWNGPLNVLPLVEGMVGSPSRRR